MSALLETPPGRWTQAATHIYAQHPNTVTPPISPEKNPNYTKTPPPRNRAYADNGIRPMRPNWPSTASQGLVVSAGSEPSSSNLLYSSEMKEISFKGSKATR